MTILLTGGRAPVTLEMARAFWRSGHRVLVAESTAWPLSRFSRAVSGHFRVPSPRQHTRGFLDRLKALMEREGVDLLIPTCEETLYVAHLAGERVFCGPQRRLVELHSKWRFAELARRLSLPVPSTERVTEVREAARAGAGRVLKPEFSRFATRTLIRPSPERVLRQDIRPDRPWVAQDYLPGRTLCTSSVAHAGRLTAHAAYAAEFTAGQGATVAFSSLDHPATLDWVRRFVDAVSFTGLIGFDFIETAPGRVAAVECNPRATSGLHLLPPRALCRAMTEPGELVTPPPGAAAALSLPLIYRGLRRGGRWLQTLLRSRDVLLDPADPLPALCQGLPVLELAWRAMRARVSLLEAATLDIEWNG
ncbi:MAG: carbamoylphosphate synthase large subunit [Candidatus Eremiobacterota bacterium]